LPVRTRKTREQIQAEAISLNVPNLAKSKKIALGYLHTQQGEGRKRRSLRLAEGEIYFAQREY